MKPETFELTRVAIYEYEYGRVHYYDVKVQESKGKKTVLLTGVDEVEGHVIILEDFWRVSGQYVFNQTDLLKIINMLSAEDI